jgi:hypothetical protein
MSCDVSFHNFIERYNVLKRPTEQISEYLTNHPTLYKAVLLVNHLFRAFAMMAFCATLPFSLPVSVGICYAGSLFYRLTVETNCAYKFALPAFWGSLAIPPAMFALNGLITGVAFTTMTSLVVHCMTLVPLAAYLSYIVLTVNYDVNERL